MLDYQLEKGGLLVPVFEVLEKMKELGEVKRSFLSNFEITHRNREINKLLDVKKGDVCLDVGCGWGYWSVAMALVGAKVTAFDLNKNYIENKLKPLSKKFGVFVDAFTFDLNSGVSLKRKSFDWIIAVEVLEHVPNSKEALKNLMPLLKKDGLLVMTIPNIQSLFWILVKFLEKNGLWKHRDNIGRQYHKEFTAKEAFDLTNDFEIVQYKKLFSSHLFVLKNKVFEV